MAQQRKAAAKNASMELTPLGEIVEPLPINRPPDMRALYGAHVTLLPLDAQKHSEELYAAARADEEGAIWHYLPYGPFVSAEALAACYEKLNSGNDPRFYVIQRRQSQRMEGVASYLRITPEHGVIEIGHICLTPALQRSTAATEALYLMMKHVFDDLAYRRLEWKCNALNEGSRQAALRLGFTFEGIFRQHLITKGRNRDSAWFSLLDKEWPQVKARFDAWLAAANFDDQGRQRKSLSQC